MNNYSKSLRTHARRGLLLLPLLALMVALVLALPPDSALAHEGNVSVTAQDVYVRANSGPEDLWAIGTLYQGQRFSKQGEQSGYAWGYAYGDFQGCGWVALNALSARDHSGDNGPDCGSPRNLGDPHCGSGCYSSTSGGDPWTVTCQDATVFGNYRGGDLRSPQGTIRAGEVYNWRYRFSDRHVDSIHWNGKSVFVLASCVGPGIDRDGDGIPSPGDACWNAAEDVDGYNDADGCPEGLPWRGLTLYGSDGQGQVTGYMMDGYGSIGQFNGAPGVNSGASWPNWDIARSMATLPGQPRGYLLDGYGGLHAFGGGPAANPAPDYWGWDIGRDVALCPNGTSGYTLDGWGAVHPFGGAATVSYSAYWPGWDIANAIAVRQDCASGYVLDGYGGIHPFGSAPAVQNSAYWPNWDIARDITLRPDGNSGYVLDGYGGVHPFGGAPPVNLSAYWPNWDVATSIAFYTPDDWGGAVLDGYGGVHPFEIAPEFQTPTATPTPTDTPTPTPTPTHTPTPTPTQTPTSGISLSLPDGSGVAIGDTIRVRAVADPAPGVSVAAFQTQIELPAGLQYVPRPLRVGCASELPVERVDALPVGVRLCNNTEPGTARHVELSEVAAPPFPALDIRTGSTLVEIDVQCYVAGNYSIHLSTAAQDENGAAYGDAAAASFISVASDDSVAVMCAKTPTLTATETPTATPTPTPKDPTSDTDADTVPNVTDPDDDNDGCTDVQELSSNPRQGGLRNPHSFWDFFDTPDAGNVLDKAVAGSDFFHLLARFGSSGSVTIDPLSAPPAAPAYHTAFDRGPSSGPNGWNLTAANGSITGTDFFAMLVQFGHSCLAAP